jgi:glycosyltransferase involved in cell wall biosynthesis
LTLGRKLGSVQASMLPVPLSDAAPTLTFAIPFYSGMRYLPRALDSVRAQTDPNWRALVCDDGDTDGVEALVRGYGDERIRYFKNARNLGMAGNWNRCLELADSDLVTLLHDDDQLLPTYCALMRAAAASAPAAAAFFCRARVIDSTSAPKFSFPDAYKRLINPALRRASLTGEPGLRALLRGNFITCPTLCYRRSSLGEIRFDARWKFVLDLDLTVRLIVDGKELIGLPEVAYLYRRHDANATVGYTRTLFRFREESEMYDQLHEIAVARGWRACARMAREKRIIKLNLLYCAVQGGLRLRLSEVRDAARLWAKL